MEWWGTGFRGEPEEEEEETMKGAGSGTGRKTVVKQKPQE